ncbi:DUF2513 domain-containing protein [Mitsuokella jalaludinii]|uniref:DUF2513 domain-containing protein n=1 Tax=Mitsuokella TaxID=52225 RepID=UPI002431E3E9|nr:DUF2513 domain-containing protein [Mitsuokella jalaludinii]
MKLDYDLIREILLITEEHSNGKNHILDSFYQKQISPIPSNATIRTNIEYLRMSGYVQCKLTNKGVYRIVDLTPKGRDYLDNIRSEKVWKKVKEMIRENAGTMSMDIVKNIAVKVAEEIIFPS